MLNRELPYWSSSAINLEGKNMFKVLKNAS